VDVSTVKYPINSKFPELYKNAPEKKPFVNWFYNSGKKWNDRGMHFMSKANRQAEEGNDEAAIKSFQKASKSFGKALKHSGGKFETYAHYALASCQLGIDGRVAANEAMMKYRENLMFYSGLAVNKETSDALGGREGGIPSALAHQYKQGEKAYYVPSDAMYFIFNGLVLMENEKNNVRSQWMNNLERAGTNFQFAIKIAKGELVPTDPYDMPHEIKAKKETAKKQPELVEYAMQQLEKINGYLDDLKR
jgi:hypothetical protein